MSQCGDRCLSSPSFWSRFRVSSSSLMPTVVDAMLTPTWLHLLQPYHDARRVQATLPSPDPEARKVQAKRGEAGGLASVRHGLETRDNRGPRHAENDEIAGFERTPDVEHVANLGVLQWL